MGLLVLVLDNIIIKIDKFTDIKAHFLDTKTDRNETDWFYKTTHRTINSFYESISMETVWVKALYHRANKICCSKRSSLKQVDQMETFMPWIGYLSYISNSIIKLLKTNQRKKDTNKEQDNREIISLKVPYWGKQGVT